MFANQLWLRLPARVRAVRRRTYIVAAALSGALVLSLLVVLPFAIHGYPRGAQHEPAVAGSTSGPAPAQPAVTGRPFTAAPPVWPAPATVELDLPATGARVGGLSVSLAAVSGASRVRVQTFDRTSTRAAGIAGVLLRLDPTGPKETDVRLSVDYADFRWAYGADWSSRLRLTVLPPCALRTPDAAACQAQPVPTRNDPRAGTVTAQLPAASAGTLVALDASPSGPSGDYSATSLSPSATWSAGTNSGDFSWTYPLRMPPSLGGPAPTVALAYSSSSVDGRMAATNNQPSVIGEGFDYSPGTIERRYRSCSQDMGNGANNTVKTGDVCWATDNASLSLSGHAGELIKDAANPNRWHLRNDDGTLVERRTGAGNGALNGEYWVVTTTDGAKYTFGGGSGSTLTEPVYGNHAGEPCHQSTYAASSCTQAYRWSVDTVVDPHGNSMTYTYAKETSKYARNATRTDLVTYDRGGYLTAIDYGTRTDLSGAAPMRVSFDYADRCLSGCTAHDAAHWPDTPWDQECTTTPCDVVSPTYWLTKRLTTVTTKVWNTAAGSYGNVESWTLGQSFPDPGDGTRAGLWLDKISHTGLVGGTLAMPDLTFVGVQLNNRVDTIDNAPAMNWWRIKTINSEAGGKVDITYSPRDCVAGSRVPSTGALENNTLRCYPVKWTPNGLTSPIVDFFHKYVVTDVTENDLTGGAPRVITHYDYVGNPAWHYTDDDGIITPDDKTWSVWRGYSAVRTTKGDPGEQTSSETRFFRGMHGDHLPSGTRSVTLPAIATGNVPAVNDEDAYAGMVRETVTYNGPGGPEVSATVNEPWQSAATATRTIDNVTVAARFTNLAVAHTRTTLDGGRAPRTTTTRSTFDSTYGTVTAVDDSGDDAAAGDERCTLTDYARNTTTWLLDRVSRKRSFAVPCAAVAAGGLGDDDVIGDERTSYDNQAFGAAPTKGERTRTETLRAYNGGNPTYLTTGTFGYDGYGRVTQATDVRGGVTRTAYTPATGPVTTTVVTNPMGWDTTTTLNPAWGSTESTVDVNGRRTDLSFDPLGRLVSVWMPGRDKATQSPSSTYAYLFRTDGAVAVTAKTLNQAGGYVTTYTLYDGLLRLRQIQSADGAGGPNAVISDTVYDSAGRTAKTHSAYLSTTPPSVNLFNPTGVIPAQTTTRYDGAGRTVAAVFQVDAAPASPGGTEKWRTTTVYGGDRIDVLAPLGGTTTSTLTNAAGNTTEVRQYHAGVSPSGNAAPSGYDATSYRYNRKGQVDRVTDAAGNHWDYTYDLAGRQKSATDPDKGLTTQTYTDAGDLASSTDARNVTLAYTYDLLGRRTTVRDGGPTGPKRSEWTYDTLSNGAAARGHVVKAIRYLGTEAYVVETLGYTAGYKATSVKYTIPATETGLAGSYSYVYTYKQDGSAGTTRLPSLGDLGTETLTFGYNAQARVSTLDTSIGITSYVTGVDYTSFGELGTTHLRNGGGATVDIVRTYQTDTRRLAQIWTTKQSPQTTVADVRYGYDAAGNVTKVADLTSGDQQCFGTDYLRRLTDAWTPANGDCGAPRSLGALGGPAPYWQTYEYDVAGNRKSMVDHRTANGERTVTYTTTPGTHRLAGTSTVDSTGTRTGAYTYDEVGNTRTRPTATAGAQTLTWDPEGHLASSTDATGLTTYIYDADGNRLVRRDPTGRTLYLPGQELRYASGSGAKTCTRYYTFGEQVVATRTAAGVTWLSNDQQGTAAIAINALSLTVAIRRTDPYGSVRGTSGTWPAGMDKGFVGGTVDNTGLTHLGAREYDPATGRFVSLDPIIDNTDPQQMNGYTYGNDAPATKSDPTGARACTPEEVREGCVEPEHHIYIPPVDDQYDDANNNFFGPKPPGSQRLIIHTNAKAPGNGIIVCRFFIQEKDAAGGILFGDDRDFSLDANAPYRITMAWNTDTGEVSYTVSSSTVQGHSVKVPYFDDRFPFVHEREQPITIEHEQDALPIVKGGANDVSVISAKENYLDVEYSGLNSVLPCCEVNGEIWVSIDKGDVRVDLAGDDYPNFEAVQYRPGQVPRNLGRDRAGGAGGANSMPVTPPRVHGWINGECVLGMSCDK